MVLASPLVPVVCFLGKWKILCVLLFQVCWNHICFLRCSPEGNNVNFKNVGVRCIMQCCSTWEFQAALPVCGMISHYNLENVVRSTQLDASSFKMNSHGIISCRWLPSRLSENSWNLSPALKDCIREDIADGLAKAPSALISETADCSCSWVIWLIDTVKMNCATHIENQLLRCVGNVFDACLIYVVFSYKSKIRTWVCYWFPIKKCLVMLVFTVFTGDQVPC